MFLFSLKKLQNWERFWNLRHLQVKQLIRKLILFEHFFPKENNIIYWKKYEKNQDFSLFDSKTNLSICLWQQTKNITLPANFKGFNGRTIKWTGCLKTHHLLMQYILLLHFHSCFLDCLSMSEIHKARCLNYLKNMKISFNILYQ